MRLAVIIRSEHEEGLPTAAELRRAGFAVSTALGPPGGAGGCGGMDLDADGREGPGSGGRTGPPGGRLPERQRP